MGQFKNQQGAMFMQCQGILICVISAVLVTNSYPLYEGEVAALQSLFDRVEGEGKYMHMIEYGGDMGAEFSDHEAIVSWNIVLHDIKAANFLRKKYLGSQRVTVKHLFSDVNAVAEPSAEGTFVEYEAYISEIKYFGAKDKAAYWLINAGKARVDVAISALPLLARTGGLMIMPGWTTSCVCCAESILQFYEMKSLIGSLAVLQPKDRSELAELVDNEQRYNWCFSWGLLQDAKTISQRAAPSTTQGSISHFQQAVPECSDMTSAFYCEESGLYCVSCMSALKAIGKRGFCVRQSLTRALERLSVTSEL